MEQFVVDRLRASLQERVTTPDHPDYDGARATFNATVQRRPAVIVRVRDDDDVVAAVVAAVTSTSRSRSAVAGIASPGTRWPTAPWSSTCGIGARSRSTRDEDRARRRRGALAGRRHCGVEASPRGGRRDRRRHRCRRSHARRWDRLAIGASRVHLRQPRPCGYGDRGRREGGRRSRRRSGPPLGASRRGRQLRRRDGVRIRGIDPGPILAGYIHYPVSAVKQVLRQLASLAEMRPAPRADGADRPARRGRRRPVGPRRRLLAWRHRRRDRILRPLRAALRRSPTPSVRWSIPTSRT